MIFGLIHEHVSPKENVYIDVPFDHLKLKAYIVYFQELASEIKEELTIIHYDALELLIKFYNCKEVSVNDLSEDELEKIEIIEIAETWDFFREKDVIETVKLESKNIKKDIQKFLIKMNQGIKWSQN